MYARTKYPQADEVQIPTNYAGTALREAPTEKEAEPSDYIGHDASAEATATEQPPHAEAASAGVQHRPSLLSRLFRGGTLSLSPLLDTLPFLRRGERGERETCAETLAFGTEELWLLLLAAFLFFSEDGDRGCALILVALLVFF